MATVFHKSEISFELRNSPIPEFRWYTSQRLGKIANAKHLQFDIRSLDPDKFSFPYHFHLASEELFMIISGEVTLRTPDGFQTLTEGDLVFFEEGPTSAHQLYNHGETPCVYLDIRSTYGVDITEYPDSGKINILPNMGTFEDSSKVDYYKGEENVKEIWDKEQSK